MSTIGQYTRRVVAWAGFFGGFAVLAAVAAVVFAWPGRVTFTAVLAIGLPAVAVETAGGVWAVRVARRRQAAMREAVSGLRSDVARWEDELRDGSR
jgi:hypothetical protein